MITTIAKHRVRHGNVMEGITTLMQNDKADIFYSDPPWGQGNINYWQTINVRHNPEETKKEIAYADFLKQIFSLASNNCTGIILIEYGYGWRQDIIEYGKAAGLVHHAVAEPLYRSGSKLLRLDLHLFSKTGNLTIPGNWIDSIKDTTGMQTLLTALAPFAAPGKILLDPCCGMGYCARAANHYGMIFRGNELNKTRLAKTINFLNTTIK